MKFDANDLLLGREGAPVGAETPNANPLHMIWKAATRIAVALEAGKSDVTVGSRMVAALESIAKDIAVLREQAERGERQRPREPRAGAPQDRLQRS